MPECQRSDTPDEDSSMFDNSVIDTSLATTVTEPDTEEVAPAPTPAPVPVPAPARQRSPMSREEARRVSRTDALEMLSVYALLTSFTESRDAAIKTRSCQLQSPNGANGRAP